MKSSVIEFWPREQPSLKEVNAHRTLTSHQIRFRRGGYSLSRHIAVTNTQIQ